MNISVVIAFDHIDDNLNRCVESFLFGSDRNVEIILSPYFDVASNETNKISQIHSNRVVMLPDVSDNMIDARNSALTCATGDYILFAESDDWASKDLIKMIRNELEARHTDILFFSYYVQKKKKGYTEYSLKKTKNGYCGRDMAYPIWNKVFALDVIKEYGIKYDTELSFLFDFSKHIKRGISYLERPLYYKERESKLKYDLTFTTYDRKICKQCAAHFGFTSSSFVQQEIWIPIYKIKVCMFPKTRKKFEDLKIAKKEKRRRKILRREIRHFVAANIPEEISIISQNCIGGMIYHDLRRQNLSPTINLYFEANDFMRFVKNLQYYLSLEPVVEWGETFPVGTLDDLHIYFRHYKTCSEALDAWNRRKMRVKYDKIVVLCSDRYDFTDESFNEWKTIEYPKLLFTCKNKYADESSIYYKEYSGKEHIPDIIPYREYYKDDRLRELLEDFKG